MQKTRLGNSDMEITRIGFGAWAIAGSWQWGWGGQEDRESIATIHRALERGINWIDTAAVYGLGHSEKIIAQALKETDYSPYVFTKCALPWDEKNNIGACLKKESILKEVEGSLKRLDVDAIDLYQIHFPNPDEDLEEAWTTLAELQQQQKVRYIGVSNFSVPQMQRAQKIAGITSNQPPYSMIFPEVEQEILPFCREQNIGVINYSPMASGLLSGKMTKERVANLPEDDWRTQNKNFQEPNLSRNLALADLLKKIGGQYNATAGEVAIAWTLLNTAVTGAIVGLRRPDQVEGVIHAGELSLSAEDTQRIQDFLAEHP